MHGGKSCILTLLTCPLHPTVQQPTKVLQPQGSMPDNPIQPDSQQGSNPTAHNTNPAENEHNQPGLGPTSNHAPDPTNNHAPNPQHMPPEQPPHHEHDKEIPDLNRRSGRTVRQSGQYSERTPTWPVCHPGS